MTQDRDRFYLNAAWIWVLGFTLFRIIYSCFFNLVPDETNYWQWSRHLAPGYHDQAPLIAWAIHLSTSLLGNTETGVRLPSILAMAVASAYLIGMARRWIGASAAWHTALMSQAILIYNVGGLLATPDGLQAAAWAGACYHVARAYEEDRLTQWLLGGLWFGFGMLSKYTMVIFLPCVYAYGLMCRDHRKRLTTVRPYFGLLVGSFMFLPVVWWNAQNNWNSVRHVAFLGGANEHLTIHLKYFGDYIASQAALLSPLIFVLVVLAWMLAVQKPYRAQHWLYLYLLLTSLPMVAGFALLSLHTRVYGNWPGAGFLTVSALIAVYFADKNTRFPPNGIIRLGRAMWPWAVGTAYLLSALILVQVVWPVIPVPIKLDRTATEISGWKQLGRETGRLMDTMPNTKQTFLFGLRYQTASELAFYAPGQPYTVSINKWKRPNVYDYWWKDEDLIGWDAVGVTYNPESHLTQLNQLFHLVDPPVRLDIFQKRGFDKSETHVKTYYLYRAYGFKGGLRWIPPDKDDIRAG